MSRFARGVTVDRGVIARLTGAWLALTISGVVASIVVGACVELGLRIGLNDWSYWSVGDSPLLISAYAAIFGFGLSILVGWLFAALRGRIVGPRFPYLRPGYLVVVAITTAPFALLLLVSPIRAIFDMLDKWPVLQATMLLMTGIFVWLSHLFGLFGPEAPPFWRRPGGLGKPRLLHVVVLFGVVLGLVLPPLFFVLALRVLAWILAMFGWGG